MKSVVVALLAMVFAMETLEARCFKGTPMTPEEEAALTEKAEAGNAGAAMQLYRYFSMRHHDRGSPEKWLRLAAKLDLEEARISLAGLIKHQKYEPGEFGATGPEAFKALIEKLAPKKPQVCSMMADAYAEGYFGKKDLENARKYYLMGAEQGDSWCRRTAAGYLYLGKGGQPDRDKAYYLITEEIRRSPHGGLDHSWRLREELATWLTIDQLEATWKKFGINSERGKADAREIEHRARIRKKWADMLK